MWLFITIVIFFFVFLSFINVDHFNWLGLKLTPNVKKSSVLSEGSFSRYDKPLKRDGKHSLISSYSLKSKEHEKVIQKLKLYEFYANGWQKNLINF